MGQPVIVENRGGGSLAGEAVAKSPADGHTLLYYGNTFWLLPLMRSSVGYDVERDFAPIVLATRQYSVLAVHPSLPVRSVKELIALARARPGELNYSSAATGTVNHLSAELFKSLAHINVLRISYKGIVSALNALMSGEAQLMFPSASSVTGHIRIGRVKALAITSPQPSPAYPNLPTVASAGLPDYQVTAVTGLFVPAKTPAAVVARLNREIGQVLNRPAVKESLEKLGFDVAGGPPEVLTSAVRSDIAIMGKLIKTLDIRDE